MNEWLHELKAGSRGNDSSLLFEKRKGEGPRGWMPFISWRMCVAAPTPLPPKAAIVAFPGDTALSNGKNILVSPKATAGKRQAPSEHSYAALSELNTTPPPKETHHRVLHSCY